MEYILENILNNPDEKVNESKRGFKKDKTKKLGSIDFEQQKRRHAAAELYRTEILNSPILKRIFLAMFYYDYVIFGYKLPDLKL